MQKHWLTEEEIKALVEIEDLSGTVCHYTIGWLWWDETQSDCFGPYTTKEEAAKDQLEYAQVYL